MERLRSPTARMRGRISSSEGSGSEFRRSSRWSAGGGAECPGRADRRCRVRVLQRVRWPCRTPTGRGTRMRLKFTRFTRRRCVRRRARRCCRAATVEEHGRDGRDHGDRRVGAGLQLDPAEHVAPLAETLKLNGYATAQFGKCHEVCGVGAAPLRPVRLHRQGRWWRLEYLLRLHRQRGRPVLPRAL